MHSEVKELRDKEVQSKTAQQEAVKGVDDQQYLINSLMEQVNRIERKSGEKNLRIVNYRETTEGDVMNIVNSILSEKFSMEDLVVDVAHRTGRSFSAEGVHKPYTSFFAWQRMKTNTEF